MKIEKKLWIILFAFGIFAICFSGWIFRQSTAREKLFWDNTIRCETKELKEGEIKSENIALPEDFDVPKSILFKTTHTIAEVWLDGEKIYEYGNEADAPGFMKTPEVAGILWIFPETVQVKTWRSELFRYMRAIMEMKSALYTEHEAIVF